jgi:HNH endonuclease
LRIIGAVADTRTEVQRRIRELHAQGSHTPLEWAEVCAKYGNKCLSCGATDKPLTRDHVVPLALGGSDAIDNIQPLCSRCNAAKGAVGLDYRPDRNGGIQGGVVIEGQRVTGGLMPAMERMSLREAAEVLGVSKEAVRKRVIRGTLDSERDADGRVYVYLPAVAPEEDVSDKPEREALISEMRGRIQFLEDEHRRKDAILLSMTETMRALSPPERESPVSAEEGPEGAGPRPGAEGTQEAVQRPWWRRMFGG